ncbi:MAG: hypothetical protein QOI02_71 [Actinomycetota bacterium]|nr:hypothetical protein [Actinomycetota bacterium]
MILLTGAGAAAGAGAGAAARHRWTRLRQLADDTGSATAEYAIATMAAVGFAGLLVVIMRSDEVRGILTDLVRRALTFGG